MAKRKNILWLVWILVTGVLTSFAVYALMGEQQWLLLPGDTTHGHHQIEMQCEECHGGPFEGAEAIQKACVRCHGAELKAVDDSHPKAKFTDPRNADRLEKLDARYCVTCHLEHKPHATAEMGVTVPADVCVLCHEDIAEDRVSHSGMAFDTCASAGCHNYHDNQALYEDFLLKHASGVETLLQGKVRERNLADWMLATTSRQPRALNMEDADHPESVDVEQAVLENWQASGHARGGVNCSACHLQTPQVISSWVDKPDIKVCSNCHEQEQKTFESGRHGMRIGLGLSPMTPAQALIPMHAKAGEKSLTCNTCHGPHELDLKKAAVDACLSCHNDEHSQAYKDSKHFQLFMKSSASAGSEGVTCATCHLPRHEIRDKGEKRTLVDHNQNMNLRPNEKQIRSVCLDCHSLGFSIDALADAELVKRNFSGKPSGHIESIDMALTRQKIKTDKLN